MSLYEDASLMMFPSGYKEDKIYSLKPTDGSGDLNFARASSATRVNAEGLIEEVPYNKLQQSNQFNTTWTEAGGSNIVTSGFTGYDGSNDAWQLEHKGSQYTSLRQTLSSSGFQTYTLYAKAGTLDYVIVYAQSGVSPKAWFNLSNGTIGSQQGGTIDASIESVGNGWYRCSIVFNDTLAGVRIYPNDGDGTYGTTAGTIYIQDAQVNSGSTAKPYFPTTDRLNVPRIDYSNGCGSLILEPQRTNLIAQSEAFDNAYWTKSGSSVTSGFTSPDGTANAFKLVEDTSTAGHSVFRNSSTVTLDSYSFSCFVKSNGRNVKLDFFGGTNNAIFNLTTGVVVSTNGTGLTAKIETFSNGWYRCSVTQVQTSTTIYPNILCVDGSNNSSYTGDGTSGVYIYGAQLELGYATSYIPTSGATATRIKDSTSKTGISSLIGQTEGTLFFDGYYGNESAEVYLFLQNSLGSGVTDSIYIQKNGTSAIGLNVFNGSNVQVSINGGSFAIGDKIKIAAVYKVNDFALWVNGVEVATDTSGTIPTLTSLQIGTYPALASTATYIASGGVNQAMLFKTRLTDEQLADLTGESHTTFNSLATFYNYTIL